MSWFKQITHYLKNPLDLAKDLITRPLGPFGPSIPIPGVNFPLDPTKITFKDVAGVVKVEALEWLAKQIWKEKVLENVDSRVYNLAGDWTKRQEFIRSAMYGALNTPIADGTGASLVQTYIKGPGVALRNYGRWSRTNWKTYAPYAERLHWGSSGYFPANPISTVAMTQVLSNTLGKTVSVVDVETGSSDLRYWIWRYVTKNFPHIAYNSVVTDDYDRTSRTYSVVIDGVKYPVDISDYSDQGIYIYVAYTDTTTVEPTDIWIYRVGTGNAAADALLDSTDKWEMQYLPAIPLRVSSRFVDDQTVPELYDMNSHIAEAVHRVYPGATLDKLLKGLKENDLEHVITVFLQMGVAINSKNKSCLRYIWEFLREMRTTVQKGQEELFDGLVENESQALTQVMNDVHTQLQPLITQDWTTNENPSFALVVPDRKNLTPTYSTSWGTVPFNLNTGLQWSSISHSEGTGLFNPGSKVGDIWWNNTTERPVIGYSTYLDPSAWNGSWGKFYNRIWPVTENVPDPDNEGGHIQVTKMQYFEDRPDPSMYPYGSRYAPDEQVFVRAIDSQIVVMFAKRFTHTDGTIWQYDYGVKITVSFLNETMNVVQLARQVNANRWEAYTVYNMRYLNNVFRNNVIAYTASDQIRLQTESPFIFPLHERVLWNMSLVDITQVGLEGGYLVFNSYATQVKPWYANDSFKAVVMIIVIIVSIIFTWGSSTAPATGVLGTAMQVGTAVGFTGTAALIVGYALNTIAAYVLIKMITAAATKLLGDKAGAVIGLIASFYVGAMAQSGTMNFTAIPVGDLLNVQNLMKLTMAVGDAYTKYYNSCTRKATDNFTSDMTTIQSQQEEVDRKTEQLFGKVGSLVDPILITDSVINRMETPSSFFNRTLLTGSDLAKLSIEGLSQMTQVSLSTDLP